MIVNLMRNNQRWMMTVIAILVIVSMIWFFSNRAHLDRMSNDRVGTVYGQALTNTDFERTIRQLNTAEDLGLENLTKPEVFNKRDLISSAMNFIVLKHQASALGIEPSDAEVEEASRKIAAFQAPGGGFDPVRYAKFADEKLGPRGFSDRQVDELVRADLQIRRLQQVVDSTAFVSPAEIRLAYDQAFSKTDAAVVQLKKADFAATVTPTEDEIKKYFDEQKGALQFPEKRRVKYVVFGLNDDQKKLAGKERVDAMKPHAESAEQFIDKLLDGKGKADFNALAAEAKTPVNQSVEIEESQTSGYPEASIPSFAETVFHLTKEQPDSDVIDTPTAYYILHLDAVTPAKPMTIEEAKPKIVAALKDDRAKAALAAKTEEIRTKIEGAVKGGKSFADAVKEAGQTAQDVPPFSAAEPARAFPNAAEITEAATELNIGDLSKLVTTPDGGMLVYVRTRYGIDEKKFDAQKEMVANSLKMRKQRFGFMEWLRASREAADAHFEGGQSSMDG